MKVKQVPNKNHGHGGASALGAATAKARQSKKPVEVTAARTATETVFANPDGTVKVERSLSPTRAKVDGKYVPLDPSLVKTGKNLEPKVSAEDVAFSADGSGALASLDLGKAGSIALALRGQVGVPVVDKDIATYPLNRASTKPTENAPSPSISPSPSSSSSPSSAASGPMVMVLSPVRRRVSRSRWVLRPVGSPRGWSWMHNLRWRRPMSSPLTQRG